ncbi:MAG: hypothetical protein WKF34_02730 [Pyrinomonadaceae bacterium]
MEVRLTLMSLPVGSRLLVRSRKDWRFATVSRVADEKIVLTVSSPSGRNYRLRPEASREIFMEGLIPILAGEEPDDWRENFCRYDCRW